MKAKKLKNIRLRTANDEDLPFIFSSWLKSYRSSHFAKKITNTIYFGDHHKVIEHLLKNSIVMISCNEEDPSQIYGYAVGSQVDGIFILHFIYVKHTFRNMGIGSMLLDSYGFDKENASLYTHHTDVAERLSAKYNFVYHPYLMFSGESDAKK